MKLSTAGQVFVMNRWLITLFASATYLLCLSGCGAGGNPATVREGHLVKVFCDDKPIGGVEVRLYNVPHVDGNKPMYVGFSDTSGSAYLTPVGEDSPAIDSIQWKVALVSDGDGSWMLDPKFDDPGKTGIELKFDAGSATGDDAPSIRLPASAVLSMTR